MKRLSRGEQIWVAGLLFLALCLGVKSVWLDSWKPHDPQGVIWLENAQKALADEQDTWFHENGILFDRIVSIKEKAAEKTGDPPVLKITVRSYVGGYLPMGDRKLTIPGADTD